MGRPPLPVGTYGRIGFVKEPSGVRARVAFRDHDGRRRPVSAFGKTKAEAERRLKEALRDRGPTGSGDELGPESTVAALAERWLDEVERRGRSARTVELYRFAVTNYVLPAMSSLRLREVRVSTVDRTLRAVRDTRGTGAARTARSVLSGMFGVAVRHDALPANPVRDTTPIEAERKRVRALTVDEVEELSDGLRSSQRAVDLDLPDLVDYMLATGMRIGEACAVRDDVLDLDAGTVEVNATIVRVPGAGLIVQNRPKTAAGWRVLAMPSYAVEMLRQRNADLRVRGPEGVVFCSPSGRLRDPSNTAGDLREVLDVLGFPWVTSHVFRKTVATRLDEAGLSARAIADQLGHARPSLTQDVYMGRNVVSSEAARVLDR